MSNFCLQVIAAPASLWGAIPSRGIRQSEIDIAASQLATPLLLLLTLSQHFPKRDDFGLIRGRERKLQCVSFEVLQEILKGKDGDLLFRKAKFQDVYVKDIWMLHDGNWLNDTV